MMKNSDRLMQIWFVVAATLFLIAGMTTSCATLDKKEVLSVHDRMITLYMEAIVFFDSVDMTAEQRIKVGNMIIRAEEIYSDMVDLYGEASDIAARWDVLIATLKLIK